MIARIKEIATGAMWWLLAAWLILSLIGEASLSPRAGGACGEEGYHWISVGDFYNHDLSCERDPD